MELVNEMYGAEEAIAKGEISQPFIADVQRNLLLLLAPFAPFLTHELWEYSGESGTLLRAPWPAYDAALTREEEVEIVIQVNSKIKSRLTVPADSTEDLIRERALADEKVQAAIAGKQIVKTMVVAGKLVNIVVKQGFIPYSQESASPKQNRRRGAGFLPSRSYLLLLVSRNIFTCSPGRLK
jgi:leucyl-tRNA synthetase